jgi:CheY-like chemotaxis protein
LGEASGGASARPGGAVRRNRKTRSRLSLRVLCIEDDEQVLSVLADLLHSEGYDVATATTAEAGLAHLRKGTFDLIVTDYWLPDRTAAWMLGEASQQGVLHDTPVLVITAEHRPQGVENLKVLRKPLDLDDFIGIVEQSLQPARESEVERTRREFESRYKKQDGESSVKVDLALYISASSPSSLKAVRNLKRLLSEYDAGQVRLHVYDLSRTAAATADEDRIAFTPTLVKRWPEPKMWVLGDLDDASVVSDLLAHCGVERHR